MMKKYFNLMPFVKIIHGVTRNILYDSQRQNIKFISGVEVEILLNLAKHDIDTVALGYRKKTLNDLINSYVETGCGIVTSSINSRKMLILSELYESPNLIENAIIIIDENTNSSIYSEAINQLSELNCRVISIRMYSENASLLHLEHCLSKIKESQILHCELLLPIENKGLVNCLIGDNNSHVDFSIFYFGCKKSDFIPGSPNQYYIKGKLNKNDCGVFHPSLLNLDYSHFCLSKSYNSCLFKKVVIDEVGNIKNCPLFAHSYGKMFENTLADIISLKKFQKWWHIKKDDISVCSGCEFRYFCHDCRACTVEDKLFEKPLNCSYNPKTTKWK